jgi:hypothetical protein
MRSLDGGGAAPDPASLTSLLLVIDLTNASPLAKGQLRVLSAETLPEE